MNITAGINIVYQIGCFIGTICIIFRLFEQYYSNEDASIVLIKKFSQTKRNSFPAITLCFESGSSDGLYDNQQILSTTGLTANQYRDIMMGNIKIPHSSGLDELNFEMATIKLKNYLEIIWL